MEISGVPIRYAESGASRSVHFTTNALQIVRDIQTGFAGYSLVDLDAGDFGSWVDCWKALGEGLRFPSDSLGPADLPAYAVNANAFLDWMTDLSWIDPLQGVVVILRDSGRLWATWPVDMGILIEIWLIAAEYWTRPEVPCHLVFECKQNPNL